MSRGFKSLLLRQSKTIRPHGLVVFFFILFALTYGPNLSLPMGEMSRSDREGFGALFEGAVICFAMTEGVLSKIRIRLTLKRICLRAAPSVTADAAPPSSRRKALALSVLLRTVHSRSQIESFYLLFSEKQKQISSVNQII